jgi:hypothetical protein
LTDLLLFYSEWLYGPIDEELENKLYFLTTEKDFFNSYIYPKLIKEFNSVEDKEKLKSKFGLRIKI